MKLERWNKVTLLRPDPQIIWDNGNLEKKYLNKINSVLASITEAERSEMMETAIAKNAE